MKKSTRSWIVLLSMTAALLVSAAGTAYAQQVARFASHSSAAMQEDALDRPAAACAAMEAGEVVWVTLDEDGNVAEEVESYPSETTRITAQFEYSCVPRKTKLVTVWSIDGEAVLTSEDKPKATDKKDTWSAYLYMKDDAALPDGEYTVAFYIGEDQLTEGTVNIGGEEPAPTPTSVSVEGKIVDSKSKKAIKGAIIVVLNEGVVAADWLESGTDEDVYASAKTDSKGQFVLDNPVEIGVAHSLLIGATGYKPILEEEWVLEEGTEDPLVLNIKLVKK